MRVILREDVDHLGTAGEVVTVKPGYGRNFLFPRGLALPATESDVRRIEHEKRVISARNAKLQKELEGQASKLGSVRVTIYQAVGEGDRLYGSVTSRDIADALEAAGHKVDSKKIDLPEPIKALGDHDVPVKLGKGVSAKVKVTVLKKT
jgi:large subunit ribosomal protein L9